MVFRVTEAKAMLNEVWLKLIGNKGEGLNENKIPLKTWENTFREPPLVRGPLQGIQRENIDLYDEKRTYKTLDEAIRARSEKYMAYNDKLTRVAVDLFTERPDAILVVLADRVRDLFTILDELHKAILLFENEPQASSLRNLELANARVQDLFDDEIRKIADGLNFYDKKVPQEHWNHKDKLETSVQESLGIIADFTEKNMLYQANLFQDRRQLLGKNIDEMKSEIQTQITSGHGGKTTSRKLTAERISHLNIRDPNQFVMRLRAECEAMPEDSTLRKSIESVLAPIDLEETPFSAMKIAAAAKLFEYVLKEEASTRWGFGFFTKSIDKATQTNMDTAINIADKILQCDSQPQVDKVLDEIKDKIVEIIRTNTELTGHLHDASELMMNFNRLDLQREQVSPSS